MGAAWVPNAPPSASHSPLPGPASRLTTHDPQSAPGCRRTLAGAARDAAIELLRRSLGSPTRATLKASFSVEDKHKQFNSISTDQAASRCARPPTHRTQVTDLEPHRHRPSCSIPLHAALRAYFGCGCS